MRSTRPSTDPSAVCTAARWTRTHCGCEARGLPSSNGNARAPISSIRTARARTARTCRIDVVPSAYVHTFGSSVRAYVHACVAVLAFVGEFAPHGCVHACMLLHAHPPRTCIAHSRCRWVLAQPELTSSLLGDGGWAQQKGDNGQQ